MQIIRHGDNNGYPAYCSQYPSSYQSNKNCVVINYIQKLTINLLDSHIHPLKHNRLQWAYIIDTSYTTGHEYHFEQNRYLTSLASLLGACIRIDWSHNAGPSLTTATWRCRKYFSQWERSFLWKLCYHWLRGLRQRQIALVRQGQVRN